MCRSLLLPPHPPLTAPEKLGQWARESEREGGREERGQKRVCPFAEAMLEKNVRNAHCNLQR